MQSKGVVLAAAVLALACPAGAQQQQAPPTYETALLRQWKGVHNKILAMARDFPEDKFDSRPHKDSRSFLEEVRHVTIGLEMTTAILRGQQFDFGAREKADAGKPKTRESLVGELEAAILVSFAEVEKSPSPRLLGWLEHQGEHYGKLTAIYRMNNLVPPASRPRN
jgi:hypothetical protein